MSTGLFTKDIRNQIDSYLIEHPIDKDKPHPYKEAADKFHTYEEYIRSRYRFVMSKLNTYPDPAKTEVPPKEEWMEGYRKFKQAESGSADLVFVTGKRIKTKEDLIEFAEVDVTKWNVVSYEVTTWEGYRKNKSSDLQWQRGVSNGFVVDKGGMLLQTLYRVNVKLSPRRLDSDLGLQKEAIMAELRAYSPIVKSRFDYTPGQRTCLLELATFDLHFGSLAWGEESGENYDIKIAERRYKESVRDLLKRVNLNTVEKILLPLGNDLFNIDGKNNTTSNGTLVDTDVRFQKMLKVVRRIIVEVIDELSLIAPVDVIIVPGNHDCYSNDTEVLTNSGWKYYYDIKQEDTIATMNVVSKQIEYQKYQNLFSKVYKGEMYHLAHRHTDLLITPSHRFLSRSAGDDEYSFKEIKDISFVNSKYIRISAESFVSDSPAITDDELRLLAWINSDGSICYGKKRKKPVYKLYQAEGKHFIIKDLLERMGIGYSLSSRKRTVNAICGRELIKKENVHYVFELNNKNTGEYMMDRINFLIKEKYRVPDILFSCSKRQVKVYVDSFIDGDGTRKKDYDNGATIYGVKTMLDSLQHLLVNNGFCCKLNSYREKNWRLYIQYNKKNANICNKNISKIEYDGIVWCLTVPNSNFITRRNGCVNIQGNCVTSFVLGEILDAFYHNNAKITINNSPRSRKYYEYGKTSIQFTHGNEESHHDLGLIFANEQPELWAKTKFRFCQLGHFHKNKKINYVSVDEFQGFQVQVLPTLSSPTAWADKKGYSSLKQAKAFLFDKKEGLIGEFTTTI